MEDNTAIFSVTVPDEGGLFFVVYEDRWYGFHTIIFNSGLPLGIDDVCNSILLEEGPDYNWVTRSRVVQELGEESTKVDFVLEINKDTGEIAKGLLQ